MESLTKGRVSRRSFLAALTAVGVGSLVSACGGAPSPTAAPAKPTEKPAGAATAPAGGAATPAPNTPTTAAATAQPAAKPAPAKATKPVRVLLVGYAMEDGQDALTKKNYLGLTKLAPKIKEQLPEAPIEFISIPWGTGATNYTAKTQAMLLANEADLYMAPGIDDWVNQGFVVDLEPLMKADNLKEDVWLPGLLEGWKTWGPKDTAPKSYCLPLMGDCRYIGWDKQIFAELGAKPFPKSPTLEDIQSLAPTLTTTNPKTKQKNYGYYYRGKYIAFQYLAMVDALNGALFKQTGPGSGGLEFAFNSPTAVKALESLLQLAKLAPSASLSTGDPPPGWLTSTNVVAIAPEVTPGDFLIAAEANLGDKVGFALNLKGSNGRGGIFVGPPMFMAKSSPDQDAAWKALKFMSTSDLMQKWQFVNYNLQPVIRSAEDWPEIKRLPDSDVYLKQIGTASLPRWGWIGAKPRWDLQSQIESALAGKMTAKQALDAVQKSAEEWVAGERAKK